MRINHFLSFRLLHLPSHVCGGRLVRARRLCGMDLFLVSCEPWTCRCDAFRPSGSDHVLYILARQSHSHRDAADTTLLRASCQVSFYLFQHATHNHIQHPPESGTSAIKTLWQPSPLLVLALFPLQNPPIHSAAAPQNSPFS